MGFRLVCFLILFLDWVHADRNNARALLPSRRGITDTAEPTRGFCRNDLPLEDFEKSLASGTQWHLL